MPGEGFGRSTCAAETFAGDDHSENYIRDLCHWWILMLRDVVVGYVVFVKE